MLLVVEWYFNDLQPNLQMTVSLDVIFPFLDGNPKVMLSISVSARALLPTIL